MCFLQASYGFCLVLLQTGRSMLWLLHPTTEILIRHRFLDGILHGFLEIANPEFSSYRQHKGVISQSGATFPQPSTRRGRSMGLHGGMWAGAKAAAACVGDVISPSHPCWLQYATEAKSDQHGVCSSVVCYVCWSRKNRIPDLQKKLFALTFWHNRCQSLSCYHSSFCISKVCSWAGAYFMIQTWFKLSKWWWIHTFLNKIVLINSMV